jgi:hypothetical protein
MIDLSPKRVRMIVMIDDYANITPKAWVYCKGLIFNKKPAYRCGLDWMVVSVINSPFWYFLMPMT